MDFLVRWEGEEYIFYDMVMSTGDSGLIYKYSGWSLINSNEETYNFYKKHEISGHISADSASLESVEQISFDSK